MVLSYKYEHKYKYISFYGIYKKKKKNFFSTIYNFFIFIGEH